MPLRLFIYIAIIAPALLVGQVRAPLKSTENPSMSGVELKGMHFPADLFGNVNNRVRLSLDLNPELSAAIALFHDTYGLSERVRFEALLRQDIYGNLYLFGGLDWEQERGPVFLENKTYLGWMAGLGYRPAPGMAIEAGLSQPLKPGGIGPMGLQGSGGNGFLRMRIRH